MKCVTNHTAKILATMMIITFSIALFYTSEVNAATQKQKAKKAYAKILNSKQKSGEDVWYAFFDINRDGIPEMIHTNSYAVWNIYTYRKGKVTKASNELYIGEGRIYYYKAKKRLLIYAGGTSGRYNIWTVRKGRIKRSGNIYTEKVWRNNKDSLRYYVNDKRVSYRKYTKEMKKYSKVIKLKQWR